MIWIDHSESVATILSLIDSRRLTCIASSSGDDHEQVDVMQEAEPRQPASVTRPCR